MLIAAAVIGLMTAYYFGVRLGTYAAVGAALAFVCALVVPGVKWPLYGLVGVFVLGITVLGPRFGTTAANADLVRHLRRSVTWAIRRFRSR